VITADGQAIAAELDAQGCARTPRLLDPADAPAAAARYWGLTQQEYYARADVWPLNPQGEILVAIMWTGLFSLIR